MPHSPQHWRRILPAWRSFFCQPNGFRGLRGTTVRQGPRFQLNWTTLTRLTGPMTATIANRASHKPQHRQHGANEDLDVAPARGLGNSALPDHGARVPAGPAAGGMTVHSSSDKSLKKDYAVKRCLRGCQLSDH
jgi:hypothetical protein